MGKIRDWFRRKFNKQTEIDNINEVVKSFGFQELESSGGVDNHFRSNKEGVFVDFIKGNDYYDISFRYNFAEDEKGNIPVKSFYLSDLSDLSRVREVFEEANEKEYELNNPALKIAKEFGFLETGKNNNGFTFEKGDISIEITEIDNNHYDISFDFGAYEKDKIEVKNFYKTNISALRGVFEEASRKEKELRMSDLKEIREITNEFGFGDVKNINNLFHSNKEGVSVDIIKNKDNYDISFRYNFAKDEKGNIPVKKFSVPDLSDLSKLRKVFEKASEKERELRAPDLEKIREIANEFGFGDIKNINNLFHSNKEGVSVNIIKNRDNYDISFRYNFAEDEKGNVPVKSFYLSDLSSLRKAFEEAGEKEKKLRESDFKKIREIANEFGFGDVEFKDNKYILKNDDISINISQRFNQFGSSEGFIVVADSVANEKGISQTIIDSSKDISGLKEVFQKIFEQEKELENKEISSENSQKESLKENTTKELIQILTDKGYSITIKKDGEIQADNKSKLVGHFFVDEGGSLVKGSGFYRDAEIKPKEEITDLAKLQEYLEIMPDRNISEIEKYGEKDGGKDGGKGGFGKD